VATRYLRDARIRGRRWRGDAGSATVELTVLVTPLFVVLLLFVVLCARTASAKIDVNAAASAAARAASMAPSPAAARTAATSEAALSLAGQSVTCARLVVAVDTARFVRGGQVSVTVGCTVSLSDLGLLGVSATRVVSGEATAPIDVYHQVAP
jgi:Flp pilus assembly protein TadG